MPIYEIATRIKFLYMMHGRNIQPCDDNGDDDDYGDYQKTACLSTTPFPQ